MSLTLRITLIIGVIIFNLIIISFLKKKTISLKYSLLWLLIGLLFAITAVFPGIIDGILYITGIATPSNAVFSLLILFMLILLISLTSIVSKQKDQIKSLTQKLGILEKEVRENKVDAEEK